MCILNFLFGRFSSRFQHRYFSLQTVPLDVQCVSCVLVTDRGVGHAEHISCINLSFLNGQHSFRPQKSLPVSLTPWECGDFTFSSSHYWDVFLDIHLQLATGMIANDMINRHHIIQYTPRECIGNCHPISGTHPRAENIDNAPAMMQLSAM